MSHVQDAKVSTQDKISLKLEVQISEVMDGGNAGGSSLGGGACAGTLDCMLRLWTCVLGDHYLTCPSLLLAVYDWSPKEVMRKPSGFLDDVIRFLTSTFDILANLPVSGTTDAFAVTTLCCASLLLSWFGLDCLLVCHCIRLRWLITSASVPFSIWWVSWRVFFCRTRYEEFELCVFPLSQVVSSSVVLIASHPLCSLCLHRTLVLALMDCVALMWMSGDVKVSMLNSVLV